MLDNPGEVVWSAFGTIDLRVIYTRKYGSNPAPATKFIPGSYVKSS
jgi:hypothetical protein